jgi:pantoate--beta-alanine ligase
MVLNLFNIVGPAVAVFGKKDYQQLRVLESMVRQLALPIDIVAAETIRDSDGLAPASRNGYLGDPERVEAAKVNSVLTWTAGAVKSGRSDWRMIEQEETDALSARGWQPDYVAIRNQVDLQEPAPGDRLVILAAAKLTGTRLIDNLEL